MECYQKLQYAVPYELHDPNDVILRKYSVLGKILELFDQIFTPAEMNSVD